MVIKPDQMFHWYSTTCIEFGYVIPTRANLSYKDRCDSILSINTRVILNSTWKANQVMSKKNLLLLISAVSDTTQFVVLEDKPTLKTNSYL